jgi:c-di-GMP-binding flagellar brake protein YcgR
MTGELLKTKGELIKAKSVLKIGQRIEFYVGEDEEKYLSRIEDMNETQLMVDMPVSRKGVPVIPLRGEKLYALAVGNQCRFRFFSSYQGKGMTGVIPIWFVDLPEEVERHQNREFVRVRLTKRMKVRFLDDEGAIGEPIPTTTVDLSGNGVRFFMTKPVRPDTDALLEIYDIPEIGVLEAMCRVVRCVELKNGDKTVGYHIGAHLERMQMAVVNKIVRYLFSVQRELIAKGVGG